MNIELTPKLVIDFSSLKEQKDDLLQSIEDFKLEAKEADSAGEPELAERYLKQADSIIGIIHLIDAIQDHAVDNCGLPENEVFNLTED